MVNEGRSARRTRSGAVDPNLLTQCLLPVIGPGAKYNVLRGACPPAPARPPHRVFSADKAARMGKGGAGERVILGPRPTRRPTT
jgi:hypothetical protein